MTISAPQPFRPLSIPIQATNLIEASAGTGKTYGIAALFTRLVVLEKMPVESILAVTFTKAATADIVDSMLADIRSAKHSCMLAFYIIEPKGRIEEVLDALLDAANRF